MTRISQSGELHRSSACSWSSLWGRCPAGRDQGAVAGVTLAGKGQRAVQASRRWAAQALLPQLIEEASRGGHRPPLWDNSDLPHFEDIQILRNMTPGA